MRCLPLPTYLLLSTLVAAPAAASLTRVDGDAVAAGDGRALYRETHWVQDLDGRQARLVVYRCTDGRAFARKWMPAAGDAQAPDFEFVDGRDGYRESVRSRGSQRTVKVGLPDAVQDKTLAMPASGVIDAGFDAAVRAHWPELLQGKAISLPFLLTSRQRWVAVKLRRTGQVTWQGQPAQQLQMQLDAWFGFAVPAVTVVYAQQDRRLLEFNGTGNVRDAKGAYPQVRIRFPAAPRPAAEADLQDARTQPLVTSCTR